MPREQVKRMLKAFRTGGAAEAAPSGGKGSNNGTSEDQITSIASTWKRPKEVVLKYPSEATLESLMRSTSKN